MNYHEGQSSTTDLINHRPCELLPIIVSDYEQTRIHTAVKPYQWRSNIYEPRQILP